MKKKIILLLSVLLLGPALTCTAFAQSNWLLYLPAIIAGKGGGGTEPVITEKSILLFLPAILSGSLQSPVVVIPTITGLLNDTGITATVTDSSGTAAYEDASHGRDAAADVSDEDGHAGFVFVKLDSSGVALANQTTPWDEQTTPWACVEDKVTGLVWEVKTAATAALTYNLSGAAAYAAAFTGCGTSFTCRLPTLKELIGIVSYGAAAAPFIDTAYFPNTVSATYLSGTEVANASGESSVDVWGVLFSDGYTDPDIHQTGSGYRVRAVCTAVVNN